MKKSLLAGLTTSLIAFGLMGVASATVLTFDAGLANFNSMPQDYGDRVTAATMGSYSYGTNGGFTPNVLVEYVGVGGNGLTFWSTGFGDLTNVLNNEDDGENLLQVNFVADSGYTVSIDSFDMGNYGIALNIPGIKIVNESSTTLYSNLNFNLSHSGHLDFDFPTALTGHSLSILVDLTGLGGNSDNIGLDDIQFRQALVSEQPVPEPTTLLLMGTGFAGLIGVRRKKKSQK